jgi:hypothetical protein
MAVAAPGDFDGPATELRLYQLETLQEVVFAARLRELDTGEIPALWRRVRERGNDGGADQR